MLPPEFSFEATFGVKLVSVIFAFIASLLGLSVTTPGTITGRVAFTAIVGGILCGSLAPEAVRYFMTDHGAAMPMVINNGIAVIFGVGGMFIITGISTVWKDFGTNPWGLIDRLRGLNITMRPPKDDKPAGPNDQEAK